jgi:hypothetical protein
VRIADSMLYGHGNRGVAVTATATLDVDRVWVHDVHGPGIHVALGASASIARSSITANRRGITVFGDAGGLRTRLVVVDTTVAGNLFSGLWVRSLVGGGDGFVQATRVQVVGNGAEGVRVDAVDGSTGLASIERSTVAGNGLGVVDDGSAGAAVVVSGSTVAGNDGFGLAQAGGTLRSRGDNAVHGNNGGGAQSAGAITPIGPL